MKNGPKPSGGPFIQVFSEIGHGIDSLLKNHYNPPHWITRKTFQNHANPVKSGTIVGQKNISTFFQKENKPITYCIETLCACSSAG